MSDFKVKVSDIIRGTDTVWVGVFVADGPEKTFQRCGGLTLTPKEGAEFTKLLSREMKVEYEYNVRTTEHGIFYNEWSSKKEMLDLWGKNTLKEVKEAMPESWTLVKRIKPGETEDA